MIDPGRRIHVIWTLFSSRRSAVLLENLHYNKAREGLNMNGQSDKSLHCWHAASVDPCLSIQQTISGSQQTSEMHRPIHIFSGETTWEISFLVTELVLYILVGWFVTQAYL